MNHAHQKDTPSPRFFLRLLQQITPVLLVIAFIAVVYLYFPFRNRLQFDGDEGINLMKASLVMKGYPLYEQIWSDQPPLLTYILVGAMRLLGTQVNAARFLILLLSAVLLVAAFYILRKIWGYPHALVGALLIIMLPFYLQLSVSVMVGLPSLTFAVLSLLGVISWHQGRRWIWLVLSALAFSASVLIKLFTGFLIPIILVGLVLGEWTRSRNKPTLRAHPFSSADLGRCLLDSHHRRNIALGWASQSDPALPIPPGRGGNFRQSNIHDQLPSP